MAGRLYGVPLPKFTKIIIYKSGYYFKKGAIVIGHYRGKLRVLTEEGTIVVVSQRTTKLLDPEDTLPFGIPTVSRQF